MKNWRVTAWERVDGYIDVNPTTELCPEVLAHIRASGDDADFPDQIETKEQAELYVRELIGFWGLGDVDTWPNGLTRATSRESDIEGTEETKYCEARANKQIKLTETGVGILIGLYLETHELLDEGAEYDQDDCTMCLLGHAARFGMLGLEPVNPEDALKYELIRAHEEAYANALEVLGQSIAGYLFGTNQDVNYWARELELPEQNPRHAGLLTEQAQERIFNILVEAGYADLAIGLKRYHG